ncbi:MAG: polysaccharide biosynthesis C-terminal domain-containing protein [Saprospiraceae bacterium]|nr:polysaccharide biosynthesis C-terminal domain-containing protein [Saprospiraceae bacterium]
MGIIKRQSIKNSLVSYLGVIIGALSTIFIYPLIDSKDLGLVSFIISNVTILVPFASFALSYTVIHFFPIFKDEKRQHNGFLFLVTSATLVTSLIFTGLIYLFRIELSHYFGKESTDFLNSLPYILVITVVFAQSILFTAYASNFNRIVVPNIFQNLLMKIIQPFLILLFFYSIISLESVFKGVTLGYILGLIGLIGYIANLKQLHLKPNKTFLTPVLRKQIVSYSAFNILVLSGAFLSSSVDKMLIGPMISFKAVAVFNIASLIAETIDVPRKALAGIAAPLISESMKKDDIGHVHDIYRKTAYLQTLAGVFFLAGIWACTDSLFDLMPKNSDIYREGKYVVLILGLVRLVDMSTGTNSEIITYSKYYRFNLLSLAIMAGLNIALNLLLIPPFQLVGSALATLISTTIVNYWRMIFIYQKIKIHPLQVNMIWVVLIGFLAWYVAFLTPSVSSPLINILLKGSIVTVLFLSGILYFKLSEDVQKVYDKVYKKIVSFR